MTAPVRPPEGGTPPPEQATLADGTLLDLRPLAEEICRRYRAEFPDEQGRYGDAGIAWCVHDNQHILQWAVVATTYDETILTTQVAWLAGLLAARSFPLPRLVRDLELAADVMRIQAPAVAEALLGARSAVAGSTPG